MNHVFLDRRDGGLRLYLGGELQFDAADERLYHEPLALVPVLLARQRAADGVRPASGGLRVLILGGGDGLALRDVLRVRDVAEVHVVDRDPVVLRAARAELAGLNARAFDDPRVSVHERDALEFLPTTRDFDVVIADFTYPRDVAGARLHSVDVYAGLRAALTPGGVAAVNAVSPELTPEAFGCLAATLEAVGLHARPYTFALPSFMAEGYGRWGFFFASARTISDDELGTLAFPEGTAVRAADVEAGAGVPQAVARAMRVGPNRSDELLYHLANAGPLPWNPPFERIDVARAVGGDGPRLTVANGFARWLRQPEGRRSLDALLACLPLAQRGPAREWILEWSRHAEAMFRELDLRAFAERALRHAAALPEVWRREVSELAARVRDGVPTMGSLLETTWRVFAVFLLALLLANLLFPDNLYAKGSSSSQGNTDPLHFSDPGVQASPFRSTFRGPGGWVNDRFGHPHPAPPFVFSDRDGQRRPAPTLLALTPDLRLIEDGAVAYFAPIGGHHFVLHPDRLDVMTNGGRHVMALHPGRLADDAAAALEIQAPLVVRAKDDHRRWMAWTRWASLLAAGSEVQSEMDELERVQRAMEAARAAWSTTRRAPPLRDGSLGPPLVPGVFFAAGAAGRELVLVGSNAVVTHRSLEPPGAVTDVDRFVFAVLQSRLAARIPRPVAPIVGRWRAAHGAALDPPGGIPR